MKGWLFLTWQGGGGGVVQVSETLNLNPSTSFSASVQAHLSFSHSLRVPPLGIFSLGGIVPNGSVETDGALRQTMRTEEM